MLDSPLALGSQEAQQAFLLHLEVQKASPSSLKAETRFDSVLVLVAAFGCVFWLALVAVVVVALVGLRDATGMKQQRDLLLALTILLD